MKIKPPCMVKNCERPATRREWCNKHYEMWRLHGDPNYKCNRKKNKASDLTVSYRAVHSRLKRSLGPPSNYQCTDCFEDATEWAYIHDCPTEKTNATGNPYCVHEDHYQPMCKSCHAKFDEVGTYERNPD